MSGNNFVCGMRRFDKHSFTSDKPSNQQLHNENQQRLNDLLKQREEQDNRIFQAIDIKPVNFQKLSETNKHLKTPK